MSDEATSPQFGAEKGPIAGAGLSADAELVFIEWLASLEYQDVRYHEKVIGLLARQAMIDDDLRQKVLTDPAGALRDLGSDLALPEEFSVRFLENTATELNVVLPPRQHARERPGVLDALAGAGREKRHHRMRGVAEQRDAP